MAKKRSIIWKIKKEDLQHILDTSSSMVEVLDKLGYDGYNGNHRTLNDRLISENFNLEIFNRNKKIEHSNRALRARLSQFVPNEKVFCKDSTYRNNVNIKQRLLAMGVKYKCSECQLEDVYNKKPISLQLDHINGINTDNSLKNLRFLCPNCHSQTLTFSGKRHKKKNLCDDGAEKIKKPILRKTKIKWPDKQFLEKRLWEIPTIKISKELGVSDVAISKHIKKLGLTKPPRGHWSKTI